jgi:hypothetical protein
MGMYSTLNCKIIRIKNLNCKMNFVVVVIVMNLASFSHQRMHKMDLLSGYLFIIGS